MPPEMGKKLPSFLQATCLLPSDLLPHLETLIAFPLHLLYVGLPANLQEPQPERPPNHRVLLPKQPR